MMITLSQARNWAAAGCLALSTLSAHAAVWNLTGSLVTHDPSMYKENATWWIMETSDTGIGVKYSPDGHAWTQGLSIYPNGLSWWGQYNGNSKTVWAPDIHVWNGKAILFYAVSTFGSQKSAIGLTTATSIAQGNWTDQGAVITSQAGYNFNAIDPSFTVDKSGQPWLSFGSFWTGIYMTRLDASTLKPFGSWYHLAADSTGIENSFIMSNGSYYYLFVSKGTCCAGANSTYHISYGRSTSITGPYLDKNGVDMLNGGGTTLDAGGGRFIAPGGESVSNGVMARHELDSQNGYNGVLFLNDLYFTNGWPTY
jgi:arabinan endo-1,5-alpha-L-arabinosidase